MVLSEAGRGLPFMGGGLPFFGGAGPFQFSPFLTHFGVAGLGEWRVQAGHKYLVLPVVWDKDLNDTINKPNRPIAQSIVFLVVFFRRGAIS